MKKLLDYIQGNRRGKDAHDIERDAMTDPFLQDALDGYDSVGENHVDSIKQLQTQILEKTKRKKSYTRYFYIAASIFILFFLSAYFLLHNSKNEESFIAYQSVQKEIENQTIIPEREETAILRTEKISEDETKKSEQKKSLIAKSKSQIKNDTKEYAKSNIETQSLAFKDDFKYLESPLSNDVTMQEDTMRASPYLAKNIEKVHPIEKLSRDLSQDLVTSSMRDYVVLESKQQKERISKKELLANKIPDEGKNNKRDNKELLSRSSVSILYADQSAYNAVPVIGMQLYNEYLKESASLSKEDKCNKIKGNLIIHFSISESGRPYNIQIIKSLCKSVDDKLIEAIKNGSDWTQGQGEVIFEK